MRASLGLLWTLAVVGVLFSTRAQDVSIPDPGLNAAVREALQKPDGPLTEQDLLSLTNLNACCRNITDIAGLESARNLVSLDLHRNQLATLFLPSEFTNLAVLDVSFNLLTQCSFPDEATNLTTLNLGDNRLSAVTLPPGLAGLLSLNLEDNAFVNFNFPSNPASLVYLNLGFNELTNVILPNGLTNLGTLIIAANLLTNWTLPSDLSGLKELDLHINEITNFILPAGLTGLTKLQFDENQLSSLTLPADMTNLADLNLSFNQLTNLALPSNFSSLTSLDLDYNPFSTLELPGGLTNLTLLRLRESKLTSFSLPEDMTALTLLDVSEGPLTNLTLPAGLSRLANLRLSDNQLTSLTLPRGMTNLAGLFLSGNPLTNLNLPSDLFHLTSLNISGSPLTSFVLPDGLSSLAELYFTADLLTNLTLPPDMTNLVTLGVVGNPLTTFVLPDLLAATNLADTVASLQAQGVSVFTYPLEVQLTQPSQLIGAFLFAVRGPPGFYDILGSTNLETWSEVGGVSNPLGSVLFRDTEAYRSPQKFYRVQRQTLPANMVFIPPNTFTLGSPANEIGRSLDEGPQTTVTLTHGFWMSKFLVTQQDYLAVTGSNPADFQGDLRRPIETVSWLDATNYCALLTQRDRTAGVISPSAHYRLPTEAEWECAARAGTTTRFYYGEDPGVTNLANNAWYGAIGGATTHPVGLKLPNAWGLYDMEGNVEEWCQDWYGPYSGGTETDPQGPDSNAGGLKIIRGGAWDAFETDCRSARRMTKAVSPFITDDIIGFRVVLVNYP